MALRDHKPVVLEKFNGLWDRGNPDTTPLDHFQISDNIRYFETSSFASRDGIGIAQNVTVPISEVRRIYNYPTNNGNTLLVLSFSSGIGNIYHIINATTVFGPILTISGMDDFAFQPYAGRAYISPFTTYPVGSLNQQKGLQSEYTYVYLGDGTQARKAAGDPLVGSLTIANGAPGHTDAGLHVFGFVAEYDTGYLSAPGALTSFSTVSTNSVSFGNVPLGVLTTTIIGSFSPNNQFLSLYEQYEDNPLFLGNPITPYLEETELLDEDDDKILSFYPSSITTSIINPHVVRRHLVATKVIPNFNGILTQSELFFVPNATIDNNIDTFLNNISFFDQDLLDDASFLLNNIPSIPAVSVLSLYHNRLVAACSYNDISLVYVSHQGEPESISGLDGFIVVPLDGNPLTNAQELRDVLYLTKRSRTVAYADNGNEPSSWALTIIDNALGSSVHGIATVLDSGSANVDFLIVCTFQGITLFNGRYSTPELSWKIENYWKSQDRNLFGKIQIINAPIQKEIYCILPDGNLLVGNYANALDVKSIRWSKWKYPMGVNSIAIWNINQIIIGANEN